MHNLAEFTEFGLESFDLLRAQRVPGSQVMPAVRISDRHDTLFALSDTGLFYLLISVAPGAPFAESQMDALRLGAGAKFALIEGGEKRDEGNYAYVALEPEHLGLLTAFCSLAGVLLSALPARPANAEVENFMQDFLSLFRPKRTLDRSLVVGLWGELHFIDQSASVAHFAHSWHQDASARYDFSFENFRLEVKTTEAPRRVHHFSLEQLLEGGKPTFIGSLSIIADPSGSSISDLLESIMSRLGHAEKSVLIRKVYSVLTGDLEAAEDFRFALNGSSGLKIMSAASIPRVIVPSNTAITGVHFQVDVTDVTESELPLLA